MIVSVVSRSCVSLSATLGGTAESHDSRTEEEEEQSVQYKMRQEPCLHRHVYSLHRRLLNIKELKLQHQPKHPNIETNTDFGMDVICMVGPAHHLRKQPLHRNTTQSNLLCSHLTRYPCVTFQRNDLSCIGGYRFKMHLKN